MTRAQIIRKIVERDISQAALEIAIVQQEDRELYDAACDHFGTWDTALEYAGVRRRRASRRSQNDQRELLHELRKLCVRGGNLAAQRVRERNRKLYEAAKLQFGSWREALEAVGVNLANEPLSLQSRRHDKRQIIQDLQEQHAAGLSLSWAVACLENRSLATAAKHAFQSWRKALVAAGLVAANPEPDNDG